MIGGAPSDSRVIRAGDAAQHEDGAQPAPWPIATSVRLEIPDALIETHKYAPLTRAVKEQIFGLNAARLFAVDVNAKRNEIPRDYLTRMKMAYLDDGADPSHRWYGWIAG